MSEQIVLNDSYFLAKGGERKCYLHPNDEAKVIKIVHRNEKHNEQNNLEYKYYKFLQKKNKSFEHLTKCFGFINTNLGYGLVYERVRDYNNKPSKSFEFFLKNKIFPHVDEKKLVNQLKKYLFKNNILFIDVDLSNIFFKEISKE